GTTKATNLGGTAEMGNISEPRFTADEERIIFKGRYEYNAKHERLSSLPDFQIYEINVDGTGLHALTASLSSLGYFTKSSPTPTLEDERMFYVGTKGPCADIIGRGPSASTFLLDSEFQCTKSALIEVPAGGGEERVVSIGATAVSFWRPSTNLIAGA